MAREGRDWQIAPNPLADIDRTKTTACGIVAKRVQAINNLCTRTHLIDAVNGARGRALVNHRFLELVGIALAIGEC